MPRYNISFLLLLLVSLTATAQNKTYFGIEASVTNDYYSIHDNAHYLKNTPNISAMGGVNIRQEFSKKFFAEVAALRIQYLDGLEINLPNYAFGVSGSSYGVVSIPVRFGMKFNLAKDRFFFTPIIGYSFCFNLDYGQDNSSVYPDDYGYPPQRLHSIKFSNSETNNYAKQFGLIQTGLGLEYHVFKSFIIQFSANYYSGTRKVIVEKLTYSIDGGPDQTGSYVSKGQMLSVSTGIKYSISNLWNN